MSAEISFDSNSFQLLIILLLIISIGCYFYYDNYKIKKSISDLEYKINSLITDDNPENIMFDINQTVPKQNMHPELSEENILDKGNHPESYPESYSENQSENQSEKYPTNLNPDQLPLELDMESVEPSQLEEINKDNGKNEWEEINNLMTNTNEEMQEMQEIQEIQEIQKIQEIQEIQEISDKDKDNIEVQDIDDMLNNLLIQTNEFNEEGKEVDYTKMTVSELKSVLVDKNLPVSGNKNKLIQRILDNGE